MKIETQKTVVLTLSEMELFSLLDMVKYAYDVNSMFKDNPDCAALFSEIASYVKIEMNYM